MVEATSFSVDGLGNLHCLTHCQTMHDGACNIGLHIVLFHTSSQEGVKYGEPKKKIHWRIWKKKTIRICTQ